MTIAIHHRSLRSVLSPSNVYLWDPSTSDLWDLTAYVSRVPMGPFSISIRPVGPNGLRVMCTYGTIRPLDPMAYVSCVCVGPFSISIRPVGPDGLHVTCGPFLHLTCGTRQLVCHMSNLWDLMVPFSICIRPMGLDGLRVTCCRRGLINSN